jgi:hypothetical protein
VIKRIPISTVLVALAMPATGTMAQVLSPIQEFEGNATIPARNGTTQAVHVSVQSWGIAGRRDQSGEAYEIPLRGFYVAHLLTGAVSTTINGQTTKQPPGAYWIVTAGATMQVKVRGEFAVLETIVTTKE